MKLREKASKRSHILIATFILLSACAGCGNEVEIRQDNAEIKIKDSLLVKDSATEGASVDDSDSELLEEVSSGGEKEDKLGNSETEEMKEIYSYLQGIKSYEKKKDWTGDWCYIEAGGQQFSAFGCGVCCLANVYSTLTEEKMNPEEMYDYLLNNTDYNPDSGIGAVSWDQVKTVCKAENLSLSLKTKSDEYSQFQEDAKNADTLLVLVSSNNDDTIWKDIPGHYVNIWLYDDETDTVFLTDSKGPKNNRKTVPLMDIYKALKTSSQYQYMTISK